jgi:hypothetical protein
MTTAVRAFVVPTLLQVRKRMGHPCPAQLGSGWVFLHTSLQFLFLLGDLRIEFVYLLDQECFLAWRGLAQLFLEG